MEAYLRHGRKHTPNDALCTKSALAISSEPSSPTVPGLSLNTKLGLFFRERETHVCEKRAFSKTKQKLTKKRREFTKPEKNLLNV